MKATLRRWWKKLNQPVCPICSISYRGTPEQKQNATADTVVAAMRLQYSGIAVAGKESALVRMIHPFAEAQQETSEAQKEDCNIVCELDIKDYTGHDQRCPYCGRHFVPAVDFKMLQGVLHITSFKWVPDNVSPDGGK